ncbi:hypothetical protein COU37_00070 [Candidatus Micrarchaeota archaeon CG10_big_fil_rev_8_21_14_0_10_45_29]|nr:MAG: hypothetical protein COU37_00070 [Candidatus Micrarchaeota archaeon CG10_big_fil_rev_8_21_14_0_10_45_29]
MHICLKCGRAAQSVDEITEGCTCGSKVFVFKREAKPIKANPPATPPAKENHPAEDKIQIAENAKKPAEGMQKSPEEAPSEDKPASPLKHPENPVSKDSLSPASNIYPPLAAKDEPKKAPSSVASAILSEEPIDDEPGYDYSEVWLSKGAKISAAEPGSQVENIKQVRSGVFEVDLLGVKSGPLVVKDEDGVYYVRLPFSQPQLSDDGKL